MARVGYHRDTSLEFEAIVILDEPSGDTIEMQRKLVFDEQDEQMGMATYCLVRGGASHYGGLVAWSLDDGALALELSPRAAEVLDLDVSFAVPVDPESAAVLGAHLGRLTNTQSSPVRAQASEIAALDRQPYDSDPELAMPEAPNAVDDDLDVPR